MTADPVAPLGPSAVSTGSRDGWLGRVEAICAVEEVYRLVSSGPVSAAELPHPWSPRTRMSAVVAAYHRNLAADNRPLFFGWSRTRADGPMRVISATGTAQREYPSALVFPPGTRGRPLDPDQLRADLSVLGWWTPLTLAIDTLIPALEAQRGQVSPSSALERDLLAVWHEPFAWLLFAEPIPPGEVEREAERLAAAERDARTRGASPRFVVEAERLERRHREARAGVSAGLWRVRLVAGGIDAAASAAVAGLLVAGLDLQGTPYILAPATPPVQGLDAVLASAPRVDGRDGSGTGAPVLVGSALVAALAQVPSSEVPGVRVVERSTFDVTPEPALVADGIVLGEVVDHDRLPAGALRMGLGTLNRHTFVCGATGTGKSQTVRTLLEQLSSGLDPVPWLVIEPAKAEYARMAGRLGHTRPVLVIRPGDPDVIPGCLNPLEPEQGFPLQTHIDLVRALFLAAFEAVEPFPQVLSHALTRCYREAGWDVALGEPRDARIPTRYPTLGDLRRAALEVVDEIGYGREVTDNVRGFIDVRIGSLRLGTPGRFFEGGHPLDVDALLERNVVLELEDIGNDQDKAFFIGAVLIRITEHLRRRATPGRVRLRHVTVIEEAHRLLKHAVVGSPAAHAVELFAGMLAEIRAYGEGIIVAEQIPSKILPDVVKNSALKIAHRLPALDDRVMVGATMNLTEEQSRLLVTLPPGQAAVFADGMDNPMLVTLPLHEERESATDAAHEPPVRPRSVACGELCQARPCTLREIAQATRLAEDERSADAARLTLWIEILTVAHLVGEAEPQPDERWLAALRERVDPRTLQCAVAHRIQSAIDARYAGLAAYYRPEALAAHLADVVARRLAGHPMPGPCDGTETTWQAGRYRWIDVYRALDTQPGDTPHPLTGQWRDRGLDLPGCTTAEQMAAYRRHPDNHLPERSVITGNAKIPAYEWAAALLDVSKEPADRLRNVLWFLNLPDRWPVTRLYPDAPAPAPRTEPS